MKLKDEMSSAQRGSQEVQMGFEPMIFCGGRPVTLDPQV